MKIKEKKISKRQSEYQRLEDIVGCKWSVSVLFAVHKGINRPGAIEQEITGISKKVLSERLRKLTNYGLLHKQSFAEVPPRTEYSLTEAGNKLMEIVVQIQQLDSEICL